MRGNTWDEAIGAAIAHVETLLEAVPPKGPERDERRDGQAHSLYHVLTVLEGLRHGDDGRKLTFHGTRAERLIMYYLDVLEHFVEVDELVRFLPAGSLAAKNLRPYIRVLLQGFLAWAKTELRNSAEMRSNALARELFDEAAQRPVSDFSEN